MPVLFFASYPHILMLTFALHPMFISVATLNKSSTRPQTPPTAYPPRTKKTP